jgi:hypothetical protein
MSTWRAANRIEYIPYLNEFYSVESIQYIEQVGPIEIAYIRLSVRPHLFSNPFQFSTWLESLQRKGSGIQIPGSFPQYPRDPRVQT